MAAGDRRPGARSAQAGPYAIDTIEPPFENPWKALLFFGDHDFLPDGTAMLCTMQGDVWRVEGLDAALENVRWRRYRLGPAPGARAWWSPTGKVYVLGRDQITRLHDLNGDGEADFYECVSNAYETSPAGHDFICGLQRDAAGQLLHRLGQAGPAADLRPTASGRGRWRRASATPTAWASPPTARSPCPARRGTGPPRRWSARSSRAATTATAGPKTASRPTCRWSICPRGLDNSSGGQVTVPSDRLGPLKGQMLHLSFGAGLDFLLLRDKVDGQPQGAVVPLPGEFLSGVHRGRFNPRDGQLYVSGMAGWGTYTPPTAASSASATPASRCSCRSPSTPTRTACSSASPGRSIQRIAGRRREATSPRRGTIATAPATARRSSRPGIPGQPGHDPLTIRSAHVLDDGRTLFLEIPDLQPVNQLHLHLQPGRGRADRPVRHGPQAGAAVHRVPRLSPDAQDDRRPPDPGRHGRD